MTATTMYGTFSKFLTAAIITLSTLQALSVKADNGQQPTAPVKSGINILPQLGKGLDMVKPYQTQAPAPVKSGINTLPQVGKGLDMVKPYQTHAPVPVQVSPDLRGDDSRGQMQAPLSREIVPPSYRYGSPGYMPDGRGGRGYDFGYPGYRGQGRGGYPHNRGW